MYVLNVLAVSNVCCKCFISMLHMVASVCFKCFNCLKRMLQVFYLDVAYVAVAMHICCNRMCSKYFTYFRRMLRSASCCKCFH